MLLLINQFILYVECGYVFDDMSKAVKYRHLALILDLQQLSNRKNRFSG